MLFKVAGWWRGRERTDSSGFGRGIDTRGGKKMAMSTSHSIDAVNLAFPR